MQAHGIYREFVLTNKEEHHMRKIWKQGTKQKQTTSRHGHKLNGWTNRLVVRIPVTMTLLIAIVVVVMCVILGVMTTQAMTA